MLLGFTNPDNDTNDFHQRVADQNIQSLEDRQEEIRHAKNGFIGMLAGIVVGGVVGWLFLGPADNMNKERAIPVIRRPFTPAKVLPNDPGGMEIDNQDREIYHIVDNTPKPSGEVNIRPAPDMPKLVVENTLPPSEAMDSLVESIDGDDSLNKVETELDNAGQGNIKLATAELSAIKTNSREKVAIPEKIKDIEVTLQKSINSQKQKLSDGETEKALAEIYRVLKPGGQLFAPTFVHGEVPRTRLRMLAMRCAGLQIYNSWMVPQYLAFLQAGGFAVQEHALLGDTLAPLCYARAVPDKTRVTQR